MQKPLKPFYFNKFEHRKPYSPIEDSPGRTLIFQLCGIVTILLGCAYLHWRWLHSLNENAIWFALPLVVAETGSFIGTVLIIFNMWSNKDPEKLPPVHYLSDIEPLLGRDDRPLKIDVHIATYNEDVELVRYSIRDAMHMTYPYPDVEIKVYVLDDGRRDGRDPSKQNMKEVALEEGANYITRENNEGYKAGNLKNGLEQTSGDIFVILDADTRPFPQFLENTLGYFRNPKVAWVQTPQWFYDITEAIPLGKVVVQRFKIKNKRIAGFLNRFLKHIKTGEDIFGNDPRLFYDVILRRRNYYNAAFCCGAGSVHRREAVMQKAVKDFVKELQEDVTTQIEDKHPRQSISAQLLKKLRILSFLKQEIKPFKFHASEDIYTSMMMHNDSEGWISIQHAGVECKMLSPQDLDTCVKQRTRYASGSLDIAFKDNPFAKKGLSWGQKICYFNTIWSYFAPLWIIVFLASPVIYFFSHALPVKAYSFDFFKFFLPFQIMNTITITLGTWGIATGRGEQYYISGFWLMFRSIISAVRGEKVTFNVTPKEKQMLSNNFQHIWPHLTLIVLTGIGIAYNIILVILNRHPSLSGLFANCCWALANVYQLSVMIRAANWVEEEEEITASPAATPQFGTDMIGEVVLSTGT